MKLLLTADWHLADHPRDNYRFVAAELVWKIAREQRITDLFILGDLTEERDHHSAAFANRVVELLTKLAADMRVVVVRGNHDAADPAVPFFRFISNIHNLIYVTEPEVWGIGGHHIAVIPHGAWPDRVPQDVQLILTHQTFGGAAAESGQNLRGLRLPYRSPPIYSGDVHVPQQYGPVTYVGPPTLIKFGDDYQPRIILIDDKLQRTSMALHSPTKRLVNVVADPTGRCGWPAQEINRGDILKIRVTFDAAPLPPMSHVRANLDDAAKRLGASIYSIIPMLDRRAPVPTNPSASRSDTDLVRQYADTQSYDEPTRAAGLKIVGGR